MFEAKIQNKDGLLYELTGKEPIYQLVKIEGLNPPQAQINTSSTVGLDGELFNSAWLETREIVLTIYINGNVEVNRLNLYNLFRTKEPCRFFFKNASRDVYIDGYVEEVKCDVFTKSEKAQISILCPDPYFRSVEETSTEISSVVGAFTFPFSIEDDDPVPISCFDENSVADVYNDSSTETGVKIDLFFTASVSQVKIQNTGTGEILTLNYSFNADDRVTVNTNKGHKSITLTRNGVESNIFTALAKGSTFFQLRSGDNFFSYLADNGSSNQNVYITFYYNRIYRGV